MGNSSGKEARASSGSGAGPGTSRQPGAATNADASNTPSQIPSNGPSLIYTTRSRHSRQDSNAGASTSLDAALEPRKETKQEREARKAEKERVARAKDRERSLQEENVDGGYLVTLGTYTGTEDFSKPMVRQLMIERRLAPFWRGLNDHSESWTEHQLVAMARGLPLPAPDEIPPEEPPTSSGGSTHPIAVHNRPWNEPPQEHSSTLHGLLGFSTTSPSSAPTGSSPLFRGRSKTLTSLTSKNGSQTDLTPQETKLPHEPYINGQPVEAYLYKDTSECPICFLYYPPYLNRTRCCDQPICSECFVQIKRPDPHPPEHTDPTSSPPTDATPHTEEGLLVSEPSQCPFCVQPEFGVTYDPPPFRRGLAYATQTQSYGRSMSYIKSNSPMSSSTSLPTSPGSLPPPTSQGRRRATSLLATAPQVITTDKVRPDWAKKLSDARAQAARRSAAATALHNAAYIMGGLDAGGRLGFGRRRRQLSGDASAYLPTGVPIPNMELLLSALESQASGSRGDGGEGRARFGSRGNRTDDLEELMLMEAIRQSLVAEDERKRKEDREMAKQTKRDEKVRAKEQKAADKAAKKRGPVSWQPGSASDSMGSSSFYAAGPSSPAHAEAAAMSGKGKAKIGSPADSASPHEPSSPERSSAEAPSAITQIAQRHLEQSRANLGEELSYHSPPRHLTPAQARSPRLRNISDASDSGSSLAESVGDAAHGEDFAFEPSPNLSGQHLPVRPAQHAQPARTVEAPAVGGFSLAAMMVQQQADEGAGHGVAQLEQTPSPAPSGLKSHQSTDVPTSYAANALPRVGGAATRVGNVNENERARILDAIAPRMPGGQRDGDYKHRGDVNVVGRGFEGTATQ